MKVIQKSADFEELKRTDIIPAPDLIVIGTNRRNNVWGKKDGNKF